MSEVVLAVGDEDLPVLREIVRASGERYREFGLDQDLRRTLEVEEALPDDGLVGHMRKRLKEMINANLRYSFGQ